MRSKVVIWLCHNNRISCSSSGSTWSVTVRRPSPVSSSTSIRNSKENFSSLSSCSHLYWMNWLCFFGPKRRFPRISPHKRVLVPARIHIIAKPLCQTARRRQEVVQHSRRTAHWEFKDNFLAIGHGGFKAFESQYRPSFQTAKLILGQTCLLCKNHLCNCPNACLVLFLPPLTAR